MLLIRANITPGDDTLVNAASCSKFSLTKEKGEISGCFFNGQTSRRIVIARSESLEEISNLWKQFQVWLTGERGIWTTPDGMVPTHL